MVQVIAVLQIKVIPTVFLEMDSLWLLVGQKIPVQWATYGSLSIPQEVGLNKGVKYIKVEPRFNKGIQLPYPQTETHLFLVDLLVYRTMVSSSSTPDLELHGLLRYNSPLPPQVRISEVLLQSPVMEKSLQREVHRVKLSCFDFVQTGFGLNRMESLALKAQVLLPTILLVLMMVTS